VFNAYGPTEVTIWATASACKPHSGRPPRLGKLIGGVRGYVVDNRLEPLPIGVPGEIVLAGAGLALGYLGRPRETAAAFVPDPFSDVPGARLYRSGDRGRWHENGELEFLGRMDRQVKLNGLRIEPAEIEAALAGHPQIGAAAVELEPGTADSAPRLIAYLVAETPLPPLAALRTFLQQTLPVHAVPSLFRVLDTMPLTASGKLDRNALPAASRPLRQPTTEVETASATEQALASIWSKVLKVDAVDRHDNFFALGGHSLIAVQVAARVETRYGFTLSLQTVFERPTLCELSAFIDEELERRGGCRNDTEVIPQASRIPYRPNPLPPMKI